MAIPNDRAVMALTTEANLELASALANSLLHDGLAACISLLPVQSLYRWEGQLCHDAEVQLLIKSKAALLSELEQAVHQRHSYELPQWLSWPADASAGYGAWMGEQLRPPAAQADAGAPTAAAAPETGDPSG
ncbi:MAG: divalent-cation tolerance protein CutA [Synechococcus sp.]|nr:divalent-cation tolerance protein CutA [Synechococcus sp.]